MLSKNYVMQPYSSSLPQLSTTLFSTTAPVSLKLQHYASEWSASHCNTNPWNSVAFKKVTVFQLLNKFLGLYGLSEVHYHARKKTNISGQVKF